MALACDFLNQPAAAAAIRAAGYEAVLFYLRQPPEPTQFLNAGLGIGTIFETQAAEATLGAAQGTADGHIAVSQAQALGQPPGTIIWVNVGDFQATPPQIPQITAYYQAFYAVATQAGYACGGYATGYIIGQLFGAGCEGFFWQNAEDDQGVPGDVVVPQAALYQRVRPTVTIAGAPPASWDEDVILDASIPWWSTQPAITTEGADMAANDPISGGSWFTEPDGAVFTFDGAPYLGGLNNHPEWNAGAGRACGPALGIAFWKGDGTDENGNGYIIVTKDAQGQVHPYRFPRSGIYA